MSTCASGMTFRPTALRRFHARPLFHRRFRRRRRLQCHHHHRPHHQRRLRHHLVHRHRVRHRLPVRRHLRHHHLLPGLHLSRRRHRGRHHPRHPCRHLSQPAIAGTIVTLASSVTLDVNYASVTGQEIARVTTGDQGQTRAHVHLVTTALTVADAFILRHPHRPEHHPHGHRLHRPVRLQHRRHLALAHHRAPRPHQAP